MIFRSFFFLTKISTLLFVFSCVPQEELEEKLEAKAQEKYVNLPANNNQAAFHKKPALDFSSSMRTIAVGKGFDFENAREIPVERQRKFDFMNSYELSDQSTLSSSSSQLQTQSLFTTMSSTTYNTYINPPFENGFDYDFPVYLGTYLVERWENSNYGFEESNAVDDAVLIRAGATLTNVISGPDFYIITNTCNFTPDFCYIDFAFKPLSEGYKQIVLEMEIETVFLLETPLGDFIETTYIQPFSARIGGHGLSPDPPPYCEAVYPGSEILADSMALRERVEIIGSGMDLVYSSNRAPEYASTHASLDRISYFNPEGWTLSDHHYYSVNEGLLFLGNGSMLNKASKLVDGQHLVVHENQAYLFSSDGRHLETRDMLQNTLIYSFAYDANAKLSSITNRFAQTIELERLTNGALSKITSFYGQETQVSVDEQSRVNSIINPNLEAHSFEYLGNTLLMTKFTDPSLKSTSFSYEESSGRLLQELGPGGSEWNFEFGEQDNAQKIGLSSKLNRETQLVVDRDLETNVFSRQKRLPTGESMEYTEHPDLSQQMNSSDKNVTRTTTQDERFLNLYYRPQSETTVIDGITRNLLIDQQVSGVDANNPLIFDQLTVNSSVNNQTSSSTYDANTRRMENVDADGVVSTFEYDQLGLLIKAQNAADIPVEIVYDNLGRATQLLEGMTSLGTFSYDSLGRIQSQTNALNQTTNFTYDNANRVTQIINPDQSVISMSYTADGLLRTLTPPQRPTHEFIPNLFNLTAQYNPPLLPEFSQVETRYSYNEDKQLTKVERADGRVIDYTYDDVTGLLIAENEKSYSYFENSDLLKNATSAHQITTTYEHFGKEDVKSITQSDDLESLGAQFEFDNFFRINQRRLYRDGEQVGAIQKSFSPAGRLEAIDALNLSYEATSGRLSQTNAGVIQTNQSYDVDGTLKSFEVINTNTNELLYRYSFERDAMKRITQKQVETAGAVDLFSYTYNTRGELESVTKNGAPYSQYSYDANGNLVEGVMNGSAVVASYDEQDRLLSWQQGTQTQAQTSLSVQSEVQDSGEEFDHPFKDKNNNGQGLAKAKGRCDNTGKGVPPRSDKAKGKGPKHCEDGEDDGDDDDGGNGDNEPTNPALPLEGIGLYSYNAHGELSSKLNAENQTTNFVRNSQGYIETINLENGNQITYHLDHRDRRVAKYKNGNLVYKRLYQNELQVAMQINADSSISEFIYATKINVPDLIKKDGQTYRVITDQLGSPVLVLNIADATIVAQAEYNEWGRVIQELSPEFMPFSFAGGLRDLDTGLVRFGARDYSPQTARWISKDPIGFNGGDANLYRYVLSSPLNLIDPDGLKYRICSRPLKGAPAQAGALRHDYIEFDLGDTYSFGPAPGENEFNPYGVPSSNIPETGVGADCGPYSTDSESDEEVRSKARKNLTKEYNLYKYNCQDFVKDTIGDQK